MAVSRSDVSCRDSIQRDSCVTGANASRVVCGGQRRARRRFERTKRSRDDRPRDSRQHRIPERGRRVGRRRCATLRGPVRRSRYGAIDCRHESAACWRSAGVIVTCISFSASAKVAGVNAGPEPAPVPNVGGAPGVAGGAGAGRVLAAGNGGHE